MCNTPKKLEYIGEFIMKSPTGGIINVQVRDACGHSFPMNPQDYRMRNIKPTIEKLPVRVGQLS